MIEVSVAELRNLLAGADRDLADPLALVADSSRSRLTGGATWWRSSGACWSWGRAPSV